MPQVEYLPRVTAVAVLHERIVRLVFDDGFEGELDVAPHLWGPVFDAVRDDDARFAQVFIDGGGIAWPGGGDMAPEYLYVELKAGHTGDAPLTRR